MDAQTNSFEELYGLTKADSTETIPCFFEEDIKLHELKKLQVSYHFLRRQSYSTSISILFSTLHIAMLDGWVTGGMKSSQYVRNSDRELQTVSEQRFAESIGCIGMKCQF
ncbi:hypothetical protein ANCCAN_01051 [Ancylostoma caninum]|uniref:Uncharacterized protein n=1 Tax=Ancylostoma caninum TaxID=29170 RepID=A0A368HBQ6_ANCCA|nr:hypothetical protein ANCCAN_01051 [Ancylostoma caninum]